MTEEPQADAFNRALGERLRLARRARGWSLNDIESVSKSEFKASVVGAYERGERSLTVHRLCRLVSIYEIPLASLLSDLVAGDGVAIDLVATEGADPHQGEFIDRYLGTIQMMRRSAPSEMTIRSADLKVLSSMITNDQLDSLERRDD